MRASSFFYKLVVPCVVVFLVAGGVASPDRSQDLSHITVDRFQAEPFRLGDGLRINCWIRNTAWHSLGAFEATLRVTDASGETTTHPFAQVSTLPAGRVVEIQTKIRGVSDPEDYQLLLRQEGADGSAERLIDVEPSTSDNGSRVPRGFGSGRSSDGGASTGYPRELNLNLAPSFSDRSKVELGHLTIWRTDEQRLEVQGGVRNGIDRDVTKMTVTFSLTESDGRTTDRSVTINKRIQPGAIHPFSRSFQGIGELKEVSFQMSYQSTSSEGPSTSMRWKDVRQRLRAPRGADRTDPSDHTNYDGPLLALLGMKTVSGRLDQQEQMVQMYLLRVRMRHRSKPIQPNGQLEFEVLQNGNVAQSRRYALRSDGLKRFPESPALSDLKPGHVYWDPDEKSLYIALFATSGVQSPSALRLRFTVKQAGVWTFERLESPYMNGLVPPDRVRSE